MVKDAELNAVVKVEEIVRLDHEGIPEEWIQAQGNKEGVRDGIDKSDG